MIVLGQELEPGMLAGPPVGLSAELSPQLARQKEVRLLRTMNM